MLMRARHVLWALVTVAVLAAQPHSATAVDLRDVLTGYTYTSWTRKDGLGGPVWAVVQDANGFLWLGTDTGLVRFDGVRFATWEALGGQPLPRQPVRALHMGLDGTMWIGLGAAGGFVRIQDRTVTAYVGEALPPTGVVGSITEDGSGTIWASAAEGLFRFGGDGWTRAGATLGLPDDGPAAAHVDRDGVLWVATPGRLFRRASADSPFRQAQAFGDDQMPADLSDDADGHLWVTDPLVGFRLASEANPRQQRGEAGRGYRLLHDRTGALWVATIGQGLWRATLAPGSPDHVTTERTTLLTGLSSDAVRTVFEDRDGNIWVGTTEGVDRLAPHRVTPWTGLGLVSTIDSDQEGRVWAGSADELIPFSQRSGTWAPEEVRVGIRGAVALRGGPEGTLWVATATAFYRVEGTTVRPVPVSRPGPLGVEALAVGPDGAAWLLASGGEVLRVEGGQLRAIDRLPLDDARVNAAMVDHSGRLWVSFGSRVGIWSGPGAFTLFPPEGLGDGTHADLFEDARGTIWICGTDGLSRYDGKSFLLAGRANGLPAGGAFAVTADARGQLWLSSSIGLIRLDPDEFDRLAADPAYALRFHVYDTSDGLAGYPVNVADRNAVRASDGTLWFVTSRGISVADPRRLRAERPAPLVAIDEVRADDVRLDGTEAAPGTVKVEIDYTAPELTSPLKTRFRYRLEGYDPDWVDAGTRRQALYTGLAPGAYRFRVAVSQDDGRWSEVEAYYAFSLRPRFYQTWWFPAVTILMVAGATWAAWRVRVRQLRRQFALVLGERVRLSRELHDTLLQSLVGVALEFDAVSKSLDSSPQTARERVIKIREQVEEYIREARRSIWSLRSPALETGDLIEALRDAGARATAGRPLQFTFEQSGSVRRLSSNIEHQLLRIGQEALLNASRHAQASSIALRLHYGDDAVRLTIRDDGTGFDPAHAAEGTTDHYGLTTMRERAQQAGGRLTITSAPGQGTVVEAWVPAAPGQDEEEV